MSWLILQQEKQLSLGMKRLWNTPLILGRKMSYEEMIVSYHVLIAEDETSQLGPVVLNYESLKETR